MRGVGHAIGCMVVNAYGKGVGVKTDLAWIPTGAQEGSQTEGKAKATVKVQLDATTKPEGGNCQGKKVTQLCFAFAIRSDLLYVLLMDDGPRCPQGDQGVPWRIVAIRKGHDSGSLVMVEWRRLVMMR